MDQFTTLARPGKPEKPSADFPLFAHATRRWAKKVKGKMLYFGSWEDPDGALRKYQNFLADGTMPRRKAKKAQANPDAPTKPYAGYPLFAHATGRWAKKIRRRLHYFGPWADIEGALERYLKVKDDLHAGRTPMINEGKLTCSVLVNRFLSAKRALVASHEITARTWADYYAACGRFIKHFGKHRLVADVSPEDLANYRSALAKKWGPTAIGNEVQRIRCVFKYGFDAGMLDKPMRFGPGFKKPSRKTMRQHRATSGVRMFEATELSKILKKAGQPLKAMILLGINCGFGNADCGTLPLSALDLDGGWLDFPRPKTGVARRCKLWPETIQALQEWLPLRPVAKDKQHADKVFVTRWGGPFHEVMRVERLSEEKIYPSLDSPITKEMAKLLGKLKMKRPGLNFYALRHSFETIAGESKDQVAVDHVMGHAREDMSSVYRERISDERLESVANQVRDWLFKK